MSPLFGFGGNDDAKKIGEDMQKLAEQIGTLQQQLAAKNAEADSLRAQANVNANASTALTAAQNQMQTLRNQLAELQKQQANNTALSSDLQKAHAQIEQLQHQLSSMQTQTQSAGKSIESTESVKVSSRANDPVSAPVATGGLAAGANAWVTRAGGLPLRLRSAPSLSGNVLERLQPGTQMTLIEGPTQADGHGWWHIRTTDGRQGWVAGEDLRTQPD